MSGTTRSAVLPQALHPLLNQRLGHWQAADVPPTEHVGQVTAVLDSLSDGRVQVAATLLDSVQAAHLRVHGELLQTAPLGPTMLWREASAGWLVHAMEHVPGPPAADADSLRAALYVLSGHAWPATAQGPTLGGRLVPHLAFEEAQLLNGRATVHGRLHGGTLHRTTDRDGRPATPRITGWQHACRGPAWADAALTVPRLMAQGWTLAGADAWARRAVPAYASAPAKAVLCLARATARAYADQRSQPSDTGHRLAQAAEAWHQHLANSPVREAM